MAWSLKEWQSLIKLLQDLEDAPHDRALFDKAEKQRQSLLHAEGWAAMTPAALSKLLKKQVPYQLAVAACKLLQQQISRRDSARAPSTPSSAGPTSSSNIVPDGPAGAVQPYKIIQLAAEALCLLLQRLGIEVRAPNMPIAACLEQLQRSGLVQVLQQLLGFVTQQLETEGSSSNSSSSCSSSAAANASQASSSSGNAAAASNATPASTLEGKLLAQQMESLYAYSHSLVIYTLMAPLWPGGAFAHKVAPGCTQPAIQAVLALLQQCSRLHAQLREQTVLYARDLARVWHNAVSGLWIVCEAHAPLAVGPHQAGSNHSQGSEQRQPVTFAALLPCNNLLPCLTLGMATNMHALLLLQSQEQVGAGSGRPPYARFAERSSSSKNNIDPAASCSSSSSSSTAGGRRASGSGGDASSRRLGEGSSSSGSGPSRNVSALDAGSSSSSSSSTATIRASGTRLGILQPAGAAASTGDDLIGRALALIQTASQAHADLPPSHSKLIALLGCDSMALLLAAALKAEELRAGIPELLCDELHFLLRCMEIYNRLANQIRQPPADLGVHNMQQHDLSARFLVPVLLLHFAAKQVGLPAHERPSSLHGPQWPGTQQCVQVAYAAAALIDTSTPQGGSHSSVPADLQQGLLQDLLPMVEQISSAVLNLPGLAAYGRCSSGSMPSSTPASPDMQLADSDKYFVAAQLIHMVCSAAASFDDITTAPFVPAAALGSHVLMFGQLCEAAVRLSMHAAPNADSSSENLLVLLKALQPLIRSPSTLGALVEVAHSAAAAEAAGVIVEDARLQLAGMCCSLMKAASCVAATRSADAAYGIVAAALSVVLPGTLESEPLQGQHTNPTAASAVPWLALIGRVLQYFETRQQGAAAIASTAGVGGSAAQALQLPAPYYGDAAMQNADVAGVQLQKPSLQLCHSLEHFLTEGDPVSQQLSTAGYDVVSLQQQLEALMGSLPDGYNTALLTGEQVAVLRSLGIALTNLAFPCGCNNPACTQLAGPLELQLVNGRSCICAGCCVARYCCRGCQRQHWKQHKPVCQALAAAQAGSATQQSAAAEASAQQEL